MQSESNHTPSQSSRPLPSRRDLLTAAAAALPASAVGVRLAPAWLQGLPATPNRAIVIVEINGGWDYFNQIVPVQDPLYYAARPQTGIGIANNDGTSTLPIASGIAEKWAFSMRAFKDLYDRGDLAVINNIGYPNPNLSHFESFRKWHAADPAATTVAEGWLARYLNRAYTGGFAIPALDLENRLVEAFAGSRVPVVNDLSSLGYQFDGGTFGDNRVEELAMRLNAQVLRPTAHPNVRALADSTVNAFSESAMLRNGGNGYVPRVPYPNSQLATDLKSVALYLTSALQTHIFYVSTSGFDNHSNMAVGGQGHTGVFADRMRDVTSSIKAFLDDMRAWSIDNNVVVMVFSEFSRRFGMNGSIGTDHGHGGVAYLAGTPVNGGYFGQFPNLSQATQPYYNWYPPFGPGSTDFRSLYATVLERWLNVQSANILNGQFPLLPAL